MFTISGYKNKIIGLLLVAVICIFSVSSHIAQADHTAAGEYTMKAVFLYNFARFVNWPETSFTDDRENLIIAVLGEDHFGYALDTIDDRTVRGRKLHVKFIKSVNRIGKSHILYISPSEEEHISNIIESVRAKPVLTVSEIKGFCESGGMINFVTEGNKVRFEINVDAAQKAGLKISSRLLKVASIVNSKGDGAGR